METDVIAIINNKIQIHTPPERCRSKVNLWLLLRQRNEKDLRHWLSDGDISRLDETVGMTLHQESYATLNVFASWDMSEHAQVKLNINNVTDKKYLTSLYNIGYYAAPRNLSATLKIGF